MARNEAGQNWARRGETGRDGRNKVLRYYVTTPASNCSRAIADDLRRNGPHFLSLSLSVVSTRRKMTINAHRTAPLRATYTVFQRRKTTNDSNRDDNVSRITARFPQILRSPCLPFPHPPLGPIERALGCATNVNERFRIPSAFRFKDEKQRGRYSRKERLGFLVTNDKFLAIHQLARS